MTRIRILPEILSNQIAAGEVVERPASVVKELLENALDAGSSRIRVEVERGGRSLIRVADNGHGMNRDDALLSLERYATSKIYREGDLFAIQTLGFRGEALPSIASVSRLEMITKDEPSDVGTQIQMEGGRIKKVSDLGAPTGTMITVGQLFYNTPARRKFLKTITTEMGHIADTVASMALGWPQVQFRLEHNGRPVKHWSAASDPAERAADVLAQASRSDLYPIEVEAEAVAVSGWLGSPRLTRKTSRGIYVFVNGRFVRDRVIQHALLQGYSERLMKGQFPVAALFLRVPFDRVDVNVHPTKHEVRFVAQQQVHEAVRQTVSAVLHKMSRPVWRPPAQSTEPDPARVSEPRLPYFQSQRKLPENRPALRDSDPRPSSSLTWVKVKGNRPPAADIQKPISAPPDQPPLWDRKPPEALNVIGQIHDTYIVCEAADGLILVDQHAAHERILFEQLRTRFQSQKTPVQKLLVPETLHLGYRESGILERLIPNLKKIGIEIEPFGGNTFVIVAVPSLIADREAGPLVREIVEKLQETGFGSGFEVAIEQCLKLMACHGSIRANQRLSDKQIKILLEQLYQCENPAHCPHGRPIWIHWSRKFLEKAFNRIV